MTGRSNRAEVRNPMVGDSELMAEWAELRRLHPEAASYLIRMLKRLSKSWRAKGEAAWRKHKPPVGAYWKANGVNAGHLARAGDLTLRESTSEGNAK